MFFHLVCEDVVHPGARVKFFCFSPGARMFFTMVFEDNLT